MYSNVNHYYFVDDDSDEETNVDCLTDIDSGENDNSYDIENSILDELEMKHDIVVFYNTEQNKNEHFENDNNNQDDKHFLS